MTPIVLVDTMIKFIEPVVENFELQSNVPDIKKAPQVIGGFLSEKKRSQEQDPPDFPFVIVRYIDDEDKGDGTNVATVKIIVGTYSEDYQDGWRDCMNVVIRIKEELLKQRIIGGPFRVEYPIKIELPEEQPFPEWAAFLTVKIIMPSIQEEGGLEYV